MKFIFYLFIYFFSDLVFSEEWITILPSNIENISFDITSWEISEYYITDITDISKLEQFDIQIEEVTCEDFLSKNILEKNRMLQVSLICDYDSEEPVTGILLDEAKSYCRNLGGKLPSELQWTAAALYKTKFNFFSEESWIIEVGTLLELEEFDLLIKSDDAYQTSSGLKGIIGNVWEMTDSPWRNSHINYIMKGGAFDLVAYPYLLNPILKSAFNRFDSLNRNVGFRCIK